MYTYIYLLREVTIEIYLLREVTIEIFLLREVTPEMCEALRPVYTGNFSCDLSPFDACD